MTKRKHEFRTITPADAAEMLKGNPPPPLCPWPPKRARELWEQSEAGGHRAAWLKCGQCSIEYIVLTWRPAPNDEDAVLKLYRHCPECGSTDAASCIRVDDVAGRIHQRAPAMTHIEWEAKTGMNLLPPPTDWDGKLPWHPVPADIPDGHVLCHNTNDRDDPFTIELGMGPDVIPCDCDWAPDVAQHYRVDPKGGAS